MVRIQAKQETSLKWLPVQANTLPPNQVVKCVMKLNPATGKMEGKVLNVDRVVACPDGKHAQIFFKAEIKLNGVSTLWETGYLFIEHWPDLVAMFAQKPSTVSDAAVWDAKTLSWKGWLQAYSQVVKGGGAVAAANTQQSSTPPPIASGSPRRFKPQEFRPNSIAAKIIGHFEGCELVQYICPAGVSTIGLGTTRWHDGGPIPSGATITQEQAIAFFKRDAKEFTLDIQRYVDVQLTARQIAALISWAYNNGMGDFPGSGLEKAINSNGSAAEVRTQLRRWVNADGKPSDGLRRRRNAEAMLWEGKDNWDQAGFD